MNSQAPQASYSSATLLRTSSSPARRAFLTFKPAVNQTYALSYFRVYPNTSDSKGFTLYKVSNSWSASTLTYANQPKLGTRIASSGAITKGKWVSINVTSTVKKAGTYSFVMVGNDKTNVSYNSLNAGVNQPYLAVEYSPTTTPPPPPTCPAGETGTPPNCVKHTSNTKPVFVIYYMWWDHSHWTSHLGTSYPYSQTPNPLPATLDSSSCGAVNKYPGNLLTDVSQGLAYDQNNYATIKNDVDLAASLGVTGFAVNWVGNGTTTQSTATVPYDQRLAYMFQAADALNAAGTPFKIILNYQSSANILSTTQFNNDFNYFIAHYGNNVALDHTYSSKPEVIMAGTWKYSQANLATIYNANESKWYLIGDAKLASWTNARGAYLNGTSYYWSSQDPYANPGSFASLQKLAAEVRSSRNADGSAKTWFAPFSPGYEGQLIYGTPTCVPRDNGATMTSCSTATLHQIPMAGHLFPGTRSVKEHI